MPGKRSYKLKKDTGVQDHPIHVFAEHQTLHAIKQVDLESGFPPCYDQGELGSCTANAICGAYEFDQLKQGEKLQDFEPSRLMLYYEERDLEGTVNEDAGAEIKDGVKIICTKGVCSEASWPYKPDQFNVKPTDACYLEATKHHGITYKRLSAGGLFRGLSQLKQCLVSGFPFVFGMQVYAAMESEEVAQTGMVPMPQPNEECMGGHAVCCVGFDDNTKLFKVRNSWGPSWGKNGYFYIPYDYVLDSKLCDDFWVISKVIDQ